VGRLGLGLGLGSEPQVVGRLGSGRRVVTGRLSLGVFSVGGCLWGELSPGGLSPRIQIKKDRLNESLSILLSREKLLYM